MEIGKIYEMMMRRSYYTAKDLKYRNDPGVFLSAYDHRKLVDYFDSQAKNGNEVIELPLKSWNGFPLRISLCDDLSFILKDYFILIERDKDENDSFLSFRNMDSITKSRVFSEIEGSLNVESVPTTRKLLQELIIEGREPQDRNEQIIANMASGIEFVNTCPDFNEENLFRLYSILSQGCLDEEDVLLEGHRYRHDEVEIDRYNGCPHESVGSAVNSLFDFVNAHINDQRISVFLPHIAHYYIAYVHPYFDYNGRTSRMVSYWVSLLSNQSAMPPVISEAINQTKNEYYAALRETRDNHNDLTYFLLYIYKISIAYFLTYKNIEWIDQAAKNASVILSETSKTYIKKILISSKGKFAYEDFLGWSGTSMSKQAAFKILNEFERIGLLLAETGKSNKKLFSLNPSMVPYKGF